MQTVQITLLSSLLSGIFSTKYLVPTYGVTTRANAAIVCDEFHGKLATILSVTDNHQARQTCPDAKGCWIGVVGKNCTSGSSECNNYEWADGSALTNYGFHDAVESNKFVGNAWTDVDGPWQRFSPDTVIGTSCVWTNGNQNSNGNNGENEIWILGDCDDGTLRTPLCNVEKPEIQLFYYNMIDKTGAEDWVKSHPDALYQLPLVTNSERCKYANDPDASPVIGPGEGSTILQGCWALKNSGNGKIIHLSHFESTIGFENCVLQFNIDPWVSTSPEESNADAYPCIVSYTINFGSNWYILNTYGDDDHETFFEQIPHFGNNQLGFGVRFTLDPTVAKLVNPDHAECYFNNVYLWCDQHL